MGTLVGPHSTMQLLLITLLSLPYILTLETKEPNIKAASYRVNCNCQCSNLAFRDKYGRQQGNCKTADHTGALWCYVDSAYSSSCSDKQLSTRYSQQGKAWSYEACSTPDRNSPQCSYGGGHGGGHGQEIICKGRSCNGGYGGSTGGFGGSNGGYGGSSGGSVTNCRFGQPCNVGSSSGQYNPYSGASGGSYGGIDGRN